MATDRIAKCLGVLRTQIDEACPERDKSSDGWIASAAHHQQNPSSDHEPDNNDVVHALDITNDPRHGVDCQKITETMRLAKDKRIKYVIHNRHIFGDEAYGERNHQAPWTWGPYTGVNPHTAHMHVSCNYPKALADNTAPWSLGLMPTDDTQPPVAYYPLLKQGMTGPDVVRLQTLLKVRTPLLLIDGEFGPATAAALRQYQLTRGLIADGKAGPYTWQALLVPGQTNSAGDWQQNITATVFGGPRDKERSAYDNHLISAIEKCVALPWHFTGNRPIVEVRLALMRVPTQVIEATIEDIGPWLTDDNYWTRSARPLAEAPGPLPRGPNKGKRSNGAGIDLSPALAAALGISGKGLVDWRFKPQAIV
jgi:peptidoglycan hydrolase-like protein with peptidoglycan-binding domain